MRRDHLCTFAPCALQLLDLVEEAQATGTMTFNITPAQRTQLGRLQKAAHVLEGSLMQLDSMIALFNDY